jgi:hypothetical protein
MRATGRERQWQVVDGIVVITGVALLGLAVWGAALGAAANTGESTSAAAPWLTHFGAGVLALVSVGMAQRGEWRRPAQLLLILAALILLGVLVVFRELGPWAWTSLLLPAAVLLVSTPFIGPMPPPEA